MALCASPSDPGIVFMKQGDGTIDPAVFRALYMAMALTSLVCLFVTIIFNSLLTQTLRVTARDADRWRILLKRDGLPTQYDFHNGQRGLGGTHQPFDDACLRPRV